MPKTIAKVCACLIGLFGVGICVFAQTIVPDTDPFTLGKFEEAQRSYEAILVNHPNDATALAGLARARLYDDQVDEAISLANKALSIASDNSVATNVLNVAQARKASFGPDLYRTKLDQPVAIKFIQTDPLPMIIVSIGSRQGYFLIDTGAPNITLSTALATELGLPISDAGLGTFAGGRQAKVQRTLVPQIKVGSLEISNVPAAVLQMSGMRGPAGPVDGVIGTGLLMHFLSTLDYCNGQLILEPRSNSAKFESEAQSSGGNITRMWLMGDHFILGRAHLNKGSEGIFHIDTGLAGGGLMATKDTLDDAGIVVDMNDVQTGIGPGGPVQFAPFLASATFGNLTRTSVVGHYPVGGNQFGIFPLKVKGVLSHQFFRDSRLTFDFPAMRIVTHSCNADVASKSPQ